MSAPENVNDVNEIGPVQILTFAFEGSRFRGEIMPELERLKMSGIVRVIDLLAVRKDKTGAVAKLTASDLDWDEATDFGAMIGGLIGWGVAGAAGAATGALAGAAELADGHLLDDEDVWMLTEAVEPDSTAAIVLLEHVWAIPLRAAIARANGVELSNDWMRPDDLIAFGLSYADPEGLPDAGAADDADGDAD